MHPAVISTTQTLATTTRNGPVTDLACLAGDPACQTCRPAGCPPVHRRPRLARLLPGPQVAGCLDRPAGSPRLDARGGSRVHASRPAAGTADAERYPTAPAIAFATPARDRPRRSTMPTHHERRSG